jgi:conjugative relaxase-like TrwC/TraI family protein
MHSVPGGVAYYDYTFSVPKSVSVYWMAALIDAGKAREAGDLALAAACDAEAATVIRAVEAASDAMTAHIEDRLYVRTGYHSAATGEWHQVRGLIGASFTQYTSRDGDPQLHVHNAIANLAQRRDGADQQYRALDGRAFWYWQLEGDCIAQERLKAELEAALAVHMTLNAEGTGYEIDGIRKEIRDAFSSRRTRITAELEQVTAAFTGKYGRAPNRRELHSMAQLATMSTRAAKPQFEPGAAEKLRAWEGKARRAESQLTQDVRAGSARARAAFAPSVPADPGAVRARCMQAAVAEVQSRHNTWTPVQLRRELWAHAYEIPEAQRWAAVTEMAEEVLRGRVQGAETLRVAPSVPHFDLSPLGVDTDGRPGAARPAADRYATPGQMALEDYLLAASGQPAVQQVTPGRAAELAAAGNLSADQRRAVAGLLSSQRAVDVLTGPAGTGKTTTMAAFNRTFREETGRRVIGIAASTSAAREMANAGFDETFNTADWLGKLEGQQQTRGNRPIYAGEVLVLDEAAMAGNRDLAAVMRAAQLAGARLILTGDVKQLEAPDAGGGMRIIEHGIKGCC